MIKLRGMPILSRAYGSFDLRLHVRLHFNESVVADLIDEDVTLSIGGAQPAISFDDEHSSSTNHTPATLSLVKPDGRAELHVLSGRLLLSDGLDARWHCGAASHNTWASPPFPVSSFEFAPSSNSNGRAAVLLGGADGDAQHLVTLTAHMDASGEPALTIGGASRLIVDGVDVRERWQSCQA